MSDNWIKRDGVLAEALGGNDDLANDIVNSGYMRIVATHGPNGNVIYKEINRIGEVAIIGNVWIP